MQLYVVNSTNTAWIPVVAAYIVNSTNTAWIAGTPCVVNGTNTTWNAASSVGRVVAVRSKTG